jgi:hypothetical protein
MKAMELVVKRQKQAYNHNDIINQSDTLESLRIAPDTTLPQTATCPSMWDEITSQIGRRSGFETSR